MWAAYSRLATKLETEAKIITRPPREDIIQAVALENRNEPVRLMLMQCRTGNTQPTLVSNDVKFEHSAAPKRWGDNGYRIFTD